MPLEDYVFTREQMQKVLEVVRMVGSMTNRRLQRRMHSRNDGWRRILQQLEQEGQLTLEKRGREHVYRPVS